MTEDFMVWLFIANGILWIVGMWLSAIDHEQKIDEARDIDHRVRRW